MGDPRKTRSKYQGPQHPWNKERIEREKVLTKEYGLSNKKELWKVESKLKSHKNNLKRLIAKEGNQADIERKQLFKKLQTTGLLSADASTDVILGLSTEQLLDRRLQTVLVKKNLARTPKQARQFIVHGHVTVSGSKMTSPGYIVSVAEEHTIEFKQNSSLYNPEHPERVQPKTAPGALSPSDLRVKSASAGAAHVVKTAEGTEEMPVVKTRKRAPKNKEIEQQIEEEVTGNEEISSVIEEIEADALAEDREIAVAKKAQKAGAKKAAADIEEVDEE